MSYKEAGEHFEEALKNLSPKKDAALWNIASGLVLLAQASEESDGLTLLNQDDSISERLTQIEHLLRKMQ